MCVDYKSIQEGTPVPNEKGEMIMKRCLTVFAAIVLLLFVVPPAHACKIVSAIIAGGKVQVIGIGAGKKQTIYWEGTQVTKSDKFGAFYFSTTDLPIDCVGQLKVGGTTIDVVVFGCTTEQMVSIGVPQTGQTTSYADGDDGDLRKGVPWPDPRFTDNNNGTVTDNLTKLIWLKNANCPDDFLTWQGALDFVADINDGECGLSDGSVAGDWRLPNIRELLSLLDYSGQWPVLPSGHPFEHLLGSYYWSSSFYSVEDWAYYVNFWSGDVNGHPKTEQNRVIAVRGGP
jgi:hypothetical protein